MPKLTFFCELDSPTLTELFADPTVVETLAALSARVSLALVDLSAERARVVKALNQAGVPVIAWQLLPEDEGYWFNLNNAPAAWSRYDAFQAWTATHDLTWARIGIDFEPDARETRRAFANRWSFLPTVAGRLFKGNKLRKATEAYTALVDRMRADGYKVESYVLRFVDDERAAGSTLVRRIRGLVDVPVDREVPMLYTSWYGARGPAILWSYGANVQAIALGSTGGGVSVADIDKVMPLSWDQLTRDLLLASRLTDNIYIFSLEGCLRQGYLERLPGFNWNATVEIPTAEAAAIDRRRAATRALFWTCAHPIQTLLVALTIVLVIQRLIRRPPFSPRGRRGRG